MPTMLVQDGYRVRIYLPPREHAPPHVHVVAAGAEVVIGLGDGEQPPAIVRVDGMRRPDVLRAYRIVEANQARLLKAWRRYHDEATSD